MRWQSESYGMEKRYENKEKRIIEEFLIFPRRIRNEWRWLETVKIKQGVYK